MANQLARTGEFLSDVRTELKKVTWPDRQTLRQATIAIIIFVAIIGAIIALLDLALQGVLVRGIPAIFGVR